MRYSTPRILQCAFWVLAPLTGVSWRPPPPTPSPAASREIVERATITTCHDGDTCTARAGTRTLTLRLVGIDAPEVGQPLADRARDRLIEVTAGHPCRLEILGRDIYSRHLTKIWCAGQLVNERLVDEGLAYAYVDLRFRESRHPWAELAESRARRERRGLFGLSRRPLSPHAYRRVSKTGEPNRRATRR